MKIIGAPRSFTILKYTLFSTVFFGACLALTLYANDDFNLTWRQSKPTHIEAVMNSDASQGDDEPSANEANEKPPFLIMIDAGHGGEDGGAVSDSGVIEKDLNLKYSENISHLCLLFGLPYNMTREDDRMLYDKYSELEDYSGKKKSYDLKNRLKFAKESDTDLLLSVHMNKYASSNVRGLQVYYSSNSEDTPSLANAIHSYVEKHIKNSGEREAKAADSSIYLLSKSEVPAILVEFGFLSNPEESSLLSDSAYASSICAVTFVPIIEYASRNK